MEQLGLCAPDTGLHTLVCKRDIHFCVKKKSDFGYILSFAKVGHDVTADFCEILINFVPHPVPAYPKRHSYHNLCRLKCCVDASRSISYVLIIYKFI
jgi:hypothetical protein